MRSVHAELLIQKAKRNLENPDIKKKMVDLAQTPIFLGPKESADLWLEQEDMVLEAMK